MKRKFHVEELNFECLESSTALEKVLVCRESSANHRSDFSRAGVTV